VILSYHRADGRRAPAEAEAVVVDDGGGVSGWRSVSHTAVGSFAGTLPDGERATLAAAVAAVAGAGPPVAVAPPGSASETLDAPPCGPTSVAGASDGPWGELADQARALLDRLTDLPLGAIALVVTGPGRARLEHRGTDPVDLDLSAATVRSTFWHGYYESADDRTTPLPAGTGTDATLIHAVPGWTIDLPDDEAAATSAGTTWHLTVTFAIVTPSASVRCELQHAPQPPEPAAG
jgi:hypothetical protein